MKRKVHVFSFVKNESYLLKRWIPYHLNLCGRENIHIIDHNSTDDSAQLYSKYNLNVIHTNEPFKMKKTILTNLMLTFKDKADILIPMDADEFLCAFNKNEDCLCAKQEIYRELNSIPLGKKRFALAQFRAVNDKLEYDGIGGYEKICFHK